MNWSSNPPRISGWWFAGRKVRGSKNAVNVHIVYVEEYKHRWRWGHINRGEWRSCEEPKYKWAGPVMSPSLENFNKAK